jgi:hypothetical protein
MSSIIARAAESVHWYRAEDGAPQYTVPSKKDGSARPTTLGDARKMNLVPSVTTILKLSSKPGLELWKNEQLLLAALTLPRAPGEPEKDFIKRIIVDSKETAKSAAEAGTRIHESIEGYYRGRQDVEHLEVAKVFDAKVSAHFEIKPKWVPEMSFSHPLGYGGKIDLYAQFPEKSESGIVLDTKTKEFDVDDKVEGYDENLLQLAAYRHGLGLPNARCANVFVSRTKLGLIKIVEWSEEDLQRGWEMFQCLLRYWKIKNKFGVEYAKQG